MIFWILTGAIVIVWLIAVVVTWQDDWVEGVFSLVFGGLLAGLVWGLIPGLLVWVGIPTWIGANSFEETETPLKALGSDSSVEGRYYFLGGGYVDGKRVLSFIRENGNGSFTPDQVAGAASEVFESDAAAPSMVTTKHVASYWWLAPDLTFGSTYTFTIPPGSVDGSYSVTP